MGCFRRPHDGGHVDGNFLPWVSSFMHNGVNMIKSVAHLIEKTINESFTSMLSVFGVSRHFAMGKATRYYKYPIFRARRAGWLLQ